MLDVVLEKLNKAKELIKEAQELASVHNIQLHYNVQNFRNINNEMAREIKHWDSSSEQCSEDPDYADYY